LKKADDCVASLSDVFELFFGCLVRSKLGLDLTNLTEKVVRKG